MYNLFALSAASVALLKGIAAAPILDQKTQLPCTYPGALVGEDFIKGGIPVGSTQDCAGQCQLESCLGFSYRMPRPDQAQGTCYLKKTVIGYEPGMGAFMSGFTNQGCDGECMLKGMAYENEGKTKTILQLAENASPIACQMRCAQSESSCVFWNFMTDTKECELLAGATKLSRGENQANSMVLSGTSQCWETCYAQGVLIVGTPAESMELAQITPSECQDLCQELDDCSWFMLSISTNAQTGQPAYTCNMYGEDIELEMELEGNGMSISGPKKCVSNNIVKSTALLQTLLQPALEIFEESITSVGPNPSMAPAPTPMPVEPMTPPTPKAQRKGSPASLPAPEPEAVLGLESKTSEEDKKAPAPAPEDETREIAMELEVVLEETEKAETDLVKDTEKKVDGGKVLVNKNTIVEKKEEEDNGTAAVVGSTLAVVGAMVLAIV